MIANLADLLAQQAVRSPQRTALTEAGGGRRVAWAELDAQVSAVVRGFDALGLVPGYRVLITLSNRVEFVTIYLAALRARLVAVPVNPRAATGELVRMIADCGARVVVADHTTITSARSAVAGLQDALEGADDELRRRTPVPRIVAVGALPVPGETSYADLVGSAEGPGPAAGPGDPEALAVLLYTSGTSGRPRAAMLSHRALLANIEQCAAVEPPMIGADDVVLGVLPLFHVYGLNAVLGQVLHAGSSLVLVAEFDVRGCLEIVAEHGVTVVPVAPSVLGHWVRDPDAAQCLSGVRLVLSGSAPLSPELLERFQEQTGVPVHQGYGLTEAAPVVTSTLCGEGASAKPGSVGAALPGVSLRLVDESGRPVVGEDPGEIHVKGANLFDGYWPEGSEGPDAEGWYATGDVGFLDHDGELFLVDRLKELVIVSGFNVYPVEVEAVIAELDVVGEVAVIGTPDDATGEAVVAYVRRAAGTSPTTWSEAQIEAAVLDHCSVRLARFKQPRTVHVVDQLPHTVTGKVAKGRLRMTQRRWAGGLFE